MRSGEIKALTGLRIVAAVWVVLFHFRPLLGGRTGFAAALAPVLDCGAQGVDLFFILSGFVLTWNYLDRMGRTWSTRATLRFLWLRLARVWPVYLVTLHLAALWIIFTLYVGHVPSEDVGQLNARPATCANSSWCSCGTSRSSTGRAGTALPGRSARSGWRTCCSAGWCWWCSGWHGRRGRAACCWLAFAASLPPVLLLLASGEFYTPWSWLPRIVMQFTAGALACAAVRKLELERPRPRGRRLRVGAAGRRASSARCTTSSPSGAATVRDAGGLVDVLFVPLVVTLSIGAGSLPRLLSTRVMVYLGQISFALYMVHELVHTTWIWAAKQFEITLTGGAGEAHRGGPARRWPSHAPAGCTTWSRSPRGDGCAGWSTSGSPRHPRRQRQDPPAAASCSRSTPATKRDPRPFRPAPGEGGVAVGRVAVAVVALVVLVGALLAPSSTVPAQPTCWSAGSPRCTTSRWWVTPTPPAAPREATERTAGPR